MDEITDQEQMAALLERLKRSEEDRLAGRVMTLDEFEEKIKQKYKGLLHDI